MKKLLVLTGSIAVSSMLGWAGSEFGLMTSFILGTIGGGIGMYAGARLADHLGA